MKLKPTDTVTKCDWRLLVYNEEGHCVLNERINCKTEDEAQTYANQRVTHIPQSWSSYNVEYLRNA